jgi:type IV pilus biogenesis protein CpaD/CtpE
MNMKRFSLLGMIMMASLTGCQTMSEPAPESLAPDFGNSVKSNMAAQIVNPEAGKDDRPAPPLDGQKAEKAMKSYREEKGEATSERLLIDVGSSSR